MWILPKKNTRLKEFSKSSAAHSTLIIDDSSSCKFFKANNNLLIKKGLKVLKKAVFFEKIIGKISASHDGYIKQYNSIHEREIEFHPDQMTFLGNDKIIKKRIIIINSILDFTLNQM